jgi:hypothetical protein
MAKLSVSTETASAYSTSFSPDKARQSFTHSICYWAQSRRFAGFPTYRTERTLAGIDRKKQAGTNHLRSTRRTRGLLLFEEICNNDLEGIVAKRKHGIYKSNSIGWLKIKNPKYSQDARPDSSAVRAALHE